MRKYRNTTETWRHQSCGPGVHSKYWLVQSWQQILKTFLFQWPISPALQLWPSPRHNHPPISPNYTDWSNEATVCKSQQFHFYCDVSNTIGIIVTNLWHKAFRDDSFGVLMTFDHAPITGEGFFFICQKKIIFFSLFLLPWSNIFFFPIVYLLSPLPFSRSKFRTGLLWTSSTLIITFHPSAPVCHAEQAQKELQCSHNHFIFIHLQFKNHMYLWEVPEAYG